MRPSSPSAPRPAAAAAAAASATLLAALLAAAAPGGAFAAIPRPYPLFKQCDARWGNDTIETTTICAVGCLMSSTAMALGGHGIGVAGAPADPGTLNAWLRTHGGYDSSNDFNEGALPPLDPQHIGWSDAGGMHRTNDVALPAVRALLGAGAPVIANVDKGRHFVLVIGWSDADDDLLLVNDPGFDRGNYSYSNDVVGWRLFNMTNANRKFLRS